MTHTQAIEYAEPNNGLYPTRHHAKKAMIGDKAVVKVDGGYRIMEWSDYNVWSKQR